MQLENSISHEQLLRLEATLRSAGGILLKGFGQVEGRRKGTGDVVTDMDFDVENQIGAILKELFPQWQILAEENDGTKEGAIHEWCWVLDPLDGTLNFAMGVPFFSISLALLKSGEPVLGWVYDPIHDEMFHARQGEGAFLNNNPLRPNRRRDFDVACGASSGFIGKILLERARVDSVEFARHFGKMRNLGSQALQLCYVAAGRLRACMNWEAKLWDDAAGALLVREAGCEYSSLAGKPIFPIRQGHPALNGGSIHSVAAPPDFHRKIVTFWQSH